MSHAVNIKTQFKNISNLLQQFEKQGWHIQMNQKCNTYPSDPRRNETHPYVAKNPKGGYDVGINKDSEGNAYFICDFFDSSIEQQLGKNIQKIKQGYALDEIRAFMENEEMDYRLETLESGELVVIAEK